MTEGAAAETQSHPVADGVAAAVVVFVVFVVTVAAAENVEAAESVAALVAAENGNVNSQNVRSAAVSPY